jgi:hypothetical protein
MSDEDASPARRVYKASWRGCQDVHTVVAMAKGTHAHFQGWSRAMSRTRDQPEVEECPPRKHENAPFCYNEQVARSVLFFFCDSALASYWPRGTCARTLNIFKSPYQGSVQSQALSHKFRRACSVAQAQWSGDCGLGTTPAGFRIVINVSIHANMRRNCPRRGSQGNVCEPFRPDRSRQHRLTLRDDRSCKVHVLDLRSLY